MPLLRSCSVALAAALVQPLGPMYQADLYTVTLQSGTVYHWTSWDQDLTVGVHFFSSAPWLTRGKWALKNTMEVPTMELFIDDNTVTGFGGGTNSLRNQIHNGLFDGASVFLQRVYMPAPGDTTTFGTIDLFSGDVGAVSLMGARATLKVRGKNSRLDVSAPRNVYQPSCLHTFCDTGCTLNAATFTASFIVQASPAPTTSVLGWNVFTTGSLFKGGMITMTSGAASGQQRSIIDVHGTAPKTITLSRPLFVTPAAGDTFNAFQGCDKTLTTCDVTYSNKVNFRGFPFVPPPNTGAPGQ